MVELDPLGDEPVPVQRRSGTVLVLPVGTLGVIDAPHAPKWHGQTVEIIKVNRTRYRTKHAKHGIVKRPVPHGQDQGGHSVTTYRTKVELPSDLTEYVAEWTGQGKVTAITDTHLIFEFEAEDLWDAAKVVQGINAEAVVSKPQEVMPDPYVPIREGEWLSNRATPIYRCLKLAKDAASLGGVKDSGLVNLIQNYRVELNDLFGDTLTDNADLTVG